MMFEQSGLPDLYDDGRLVEERYGYRDVNWFLAIGDSLTLYVRGINRRNLSGIYSFHPGGVNMSRFDGSVQFVSEDLDETILLQMLGRSDGIYSDDL
jgi:prepilin-type processing-associated H-X9-DG protein